MEKYKITATCLNDDDFRVFEFTPENFEGIAINREFSFLPPYGFTPKFSVKTVSVIEDDADFIISKRNAYGYFLNIILGVEKLNDDGLTYSFLVNLTINQESISQEDERVYFGMDVVSAAGDYSKNKGTKKTYTLDEYIYPPRIACMNNVNVNCKDYYFANGLQDLFFEDAGESVVFDEDSSLLPSSKYIYTSHNDATIQLSVNINCVFEFQQPKPSPLDPLQGVRIKFYAMNDALDRRDLPNLDFFIQNTINHQFFTFEIDAQEDVFLYAEESLLCEIETTLREESDPSAFVTISNSIALNVRKKTENPYDRIPFRAKSLNTLFSEFFGVVSAPDFGILLTSDQEVVNKTGKMAFAAKDFVKEVSTAFGLVINFNEKDTEIYTLLNYFNKMYSTERIIPEDVRNLKISGFETIYSSVVFGIEKQENQKVVFYTDYQKKLTFIQEKENGEELDLTLSKLNPSVETLMNRSFLSASIGNTSKDSYYIATFRDVETTKPVNICDYITPRSILGRNIQILALFFANFGVNVLEMSDNDGVTFPLVISPSDIPGAEISEHADFTINGARHLRPVVYEFMAFIGEVDFSKHLLQYTDYEGNVVDLFVFSAETTDNLGEVQCKALVFY